MNSDKLRLVVFYFVLYACIGYMVHSLTIHPTPNFCGPDKEQQILLLLNQ